VLSSFPPAFLSCSPRVSTVGSPTFPHPPYLTSSKHVVSDANEVLLPNTSQDHARTALATRKFLLEFQSAITAPSRCPFPVIAAVHGAVIGLGIDIISACDIRYAASNTTFSIKVRVTLRCQLHILLVTNASRRSISGLQQTLEPSHFYPKSLETIPSFANLRIRHVHSLLQKARNLVCCPKLSVVVEMRL